MKMRLIFSSLNRKHLAAIFTAVQHGALPYPERMKKRLIFSSLNRKHLAAIFTADNYPQQAHNLNV
jgi:hypothetical protein